MKLGKFLLGGALGAALILTGCSVEQTEQARVPDVEVRGDAGQLPEYEVSQTQEGRAPDLDMTAEGGNMPEYDVDTASVDVSTETREMYTPEVVLDKEQVEVPNVDVTMPEDNENQ